MTTPSPECIAYYQAISDLISEHAFVVYCQPAGQTVFAELNGSFLRLTGYTEDEINHQGWQSIIHPDDLPLARAYCQLVLAGETQVADLRIVTKSGEIRWIRVSSRPRWSNRQGRVIRVIGVLQDITAYKLSEEALRRRDAILESVSFAAQRFLETPRCAETIEAVLERLGTAAAVSRVYIFKNERDTDGNLAMQQRHEWVAPGITPQLHNPHLQLLPYQASGFSRWETVLHSGSLICGAVTTFPRQEQAVLAAQDIAAIVIVPIFVGTTWWGFIGFDQCGTERVWSAAEMDALKAAAGIIGAAIQQSRANQALTQAEQKYRSIFEHAVEGIFQTTPDGHYLSANPALARMYGYDSPADLIESITDIGQQLYVNPVERSRFLALLQEYGTVSGFESQICRKDGRIIWVSQSARAVRDARGNLSYYEGTVEDITGRKHAEEQRLALERKLLETQKLESLGILAGGIAHDFNNLLMAILGNTSLALLELPKDTSTYAAVDQIDTAARQAADLTRQLLAYAGKGHFAIQQLDLNAMLTEMIQLLKASIGKNATLTCQFAPELPAVAAEATQIRQVIMNLLINAAEAIGNQYGVITIVTGVIHADRTYLASTYLAPDLPEREYVFLEVRDTGCGMDAETQARIFDPFFTTKFTGRGLGLAAVLGIVRSHGGALRVVSLPGEGTTFRILLPSIHTPLKLSPAQNSANATWFGNGTVLVIDDEEGVRSLIARMLERLGFTVMLAPDGKIGVDYFRTHADSIIGVLLDLTMPRMNGEQTLHALRRIRPDVRVILMSGYSEEDATGRFEEEHLAGFLQKPFTFDELRVIVQQRVASIVA